MKPRNVLYIHVDGDEEGYTINGTKARRTLGDLQDLVRVFLLSDSADVNLPELSRTNIAWYGEVLAASRSIIVLTTDANATYNEYQKTYDSIRQVYYDLWNELAQAQFKETFANLTIQQQYATKQIYPFVLSEID